MADPPGAASAPVRRVGTLLEHPHPLRKWFVAILAVWVALTFLLWGRLAQDAIPYQVAADLVHAHPSQVYASRSGDLYDLQAPFARKWCQLAPSGTHCDQVAVAFVSAPPSLPFAVLLGAPGAKAGVALARLLASLSLVVGMGILWNRLADRSPEAPTYLVVSALLLTPMASVPIVLGQTSPYLFLLACLGVQRTVRPARRWAVAGLWALTIALKLFPAVLGLVLLWQRRFRLIGCALISVVALSVLSLVVAPVSIWSDFVRASVDVTKHSIGNPYSGSLDNLSHSIWAPLTENHLLSLASLGVRATIGVWLWWWGVRDADDDVQWATAWLLVLLVVPLVWWHYLWVAVAALGFVLADRAVDRKWLVALPVLAALTIPASLGKADGQVWVIVQGLFLIAAAVAVPVIARTGRSSRALRGGSIRAADPSAQP
jgi:hypothetical protein